MISSQFYSQLSVCNSCRGWGTEKFPPPKNSLPCRECGGSGVFLLQIDQIFTWGLPTYVDFKSRNRIRILRMVFLFLLIFSGLAVIYGLSSLKFSVFKQILNF